MKSEKQLYFIPFNDRTLISPDFKYTDEYKDIYSFFKNKAIKCQKEYISKCFELRSGDKCVGYLALSLCSVKQKYLSSPKNRGLFERPAIRIGQLIIDAGQHKQGYGSCAINFVISIARLMKSFLPCRLLVVDAIDGKAMKFYEHIGFKVIDENTLVFDLAPMFKPEG
ncbi:MAG: hypothetical protein UT33_C0009G0027 [Candidatus Peregrinibacteria bacterium GW2011_GWC2_39_14]|nr:MAG: hypothetical protein US92_C0005G0027 [Candidatus Peregrinibacteria bacterium GW2011_GWA2_38_36]KKR06576.1 MAG: hypothetical protein UT33_C0009G0027 [Candidatus Peregrinibacteria bacterium GW2011_GWC2_39_14]